MFPARCRTDCSSSTGIGLRLKQKSGMGRAAKSFQEIEEQRGLAHPGLRDQYLESEVAVNPVDQRSQRLPMSLAQEQETGIGCNAKRVLPQTQNGRRVDPAPIVPQRCFAMGTYPRVDSKSSATAPKALMGADFRGYTEFEAGV